MTEKILMTGSRGRMGQVLVRELSKDYQVFGMGRTKVDDLENYFDCDMTNLEDLKRLFEKLTDVGEKGVPIKYVIHMAADRSPNSPWESVLKNNIIGTYNIYECCRFFKVKRVIFASSNHVTGMYEGPLDNRTLHLQENPKEITVSDPVRPDGFYGSSKVFGEALARQFYELHGIESFCLRIGSCTNDDDPRNGSPRWRKTWLSQRDMLQLFRKCLTVENVKFGVYFGVSNNKNKFWSIENARKEIGFEPQDDGSKY